ncbi:hypothetical protein [Streptomyces puniciscabiei]|uniref:hypothetical protein n=1 Tax=Streptomyces puniciscabiei TaxID=164348 RepID=UPI00131DD533|nr:hypothetical protein [Streptomyces puniciscabiei]
MGKEPIHRTRCQALRGERPVVFLAVVFFAAVSELGALQLVHGHGVHEGERAVDLRRR